uniref:SET domain-containing protein n=1 Tax=Polytomella parva TaxID=51329 RepID=A0A7S0UNM8_9CHLO|mmetsp:Transcript_12404/g.22190  ORF Transcript_12404/g.22190 Transcript_12404/m.22190 type:complete len:601 (+) Transcript_12404:80-1882(+)
MASSGGVCKSLCKAREKCLTEEERYWLGEFPDLTKAISPRNEAAALSWLVQHSEIVCRGEDAKKELHDLCSSYLDRVGLTSEVPDCLLRKSQRCPDDSPEIVMFKTYTEKYGMISDLEPAMFPCVERLRTALTQNTSLPVDYNSLKEIAEKVPRLRGLRAKRSFAPGEFVLELPDSAVMSVEDIKKTDFGRLLAKIPANLSDDSIALIWTMVERWEDESSLKSLWNSLPRFFGTALGVPTAVLEAALCDTPLLQQAHEARQHLEDEFKAADPVFRTLLTAYPSYMREGWFLRQQYIWAAELWYAYAIQVQRPKDSNDSSSSASTTSAPRMSLVSCVGLANHSAGPHVVHFSAVDPVTRRLRLRCFRPIAEGEQVCISYGPLPNSRLLLFYGFAIKDNPFDEHEIRIQMPKTDPLLEKKKDVLRRAKMTEEKHLVRPQGPLAAGMVAAARVMAASGDELQQLKRIPNAALQGKIQKQLSYENERAALTFLKERVSEALAEASKRPSAVASDLDQILKGEEGASQIEKMVVECIKGEEGGGSMTATAEKIKELAEESARAFVVFSDIYFDGLIKTYQHVLKTLDEMMKALNLVEVTPSNGTA